MTVNRSQGTKEVFNQKRRLFSTALRGKWQLFPLKKREIVIPLMYDQNLIYQSYVV